MAHPRGSHRVCGSDGIRLDIGDTWSCTIETLFGILLALCSKKLVGSPNLQNLKQEDSGKGIVYENFIKMPQNTFSVVSLGRKKHPETNSNHLAIQSFMMSSI